MIRCDMSEFMEENGVAKLIDSPPDTPATIRAGGSAMQPDHQGSTDSTRSEAPGNSVLPIFDALI
jgi:hypothetical protein